MILPDEISFKPAKNVIVAGKARIPVIACGSRWAVVEKPSGMSIHNDPGRDLCSLVLAAVRAGRLPAMSRDLTAIHAAHRIDRDTSGIVMLAGDSETLAFFGVQFTEKTVHKGYLALVHGRLEGQGADRNRIEWIWPLPDAAAGRNDPIGKGKRVPCTTHCRVIGHSLHYSLISCEPLSGRKHQIRRHAKLAGHPIVGDRRYGSERSLAYLKQHQNFARLALHAHTLAIRLPGDKITTFRSGGLPDELRRLLEGDQ